MTKNQLLLNFQATTSRIFAKNFLKRRRKCKFRFFSFLGASILWFMWPLKDNMCVSYSPFGPGPLQYHYSGPIPFSRIWIQFLINCCSTCSEKLFNCPCSLALLAFLSRNVIATDAGDDNLWYTTNACGAICL